MNELEEWSRSVCEALDLGPADLDRDLVLDLTKDVAHLVARPAAPLTAYLVGLAAGRRGGSAAAVTAVTDVVKGLLADRGDAERPRGQSPGTASG